MCIIRFYIKILTGFFNKNKCSQVHPAIAALEKDYADIYLPYNQRKNNVNIDTYLSDDLYYVENKYNENLNVFADLFTGLELNNYERLLLKKRFVDDMSYNKIGKDIGLSSTKIAYDCNNLYKKIKELTDE